MESKTLKKMAIVLLLMVVLTPLGLLATGEAFGEWGLEELMENIGYAPEGMEQTSSVWNAPIPDYALPGFEGFTCEAIGYIISAIVGVVLCAGALYLFGKKIAKKDAD